MSEQVLAAHNHNAVDSYDNFDSEWCPELDIERSRSQDDDTSSVVTEPCAEQEQVLYQDQVDSSWSAPSKFSETWEELEYYKGGIPTCDESESSTPEEILLLSNVQGAFGGAYDTGTYYSTYSTEPSFQASPNVVHYSTRIAYRSNDQMSETSICSCPSTESSTLLSPKGATGEFFSTPKSSNQTGYDQETGYYRESRPIYPEFVSLVDVDYEVVL